MRFMIDDFYGRKSTADQGRSVASQEGDWRDDCEQEGLTPGRVFTDDNRSASGYARKKRESYAALLEHIRTGGCELLSMWECSRGSRKLSEWAAFLELCQSHKVLIRVINDGRTYDPNNGRDWETLANEGVKSHAESKLISDRTRRGKRAAALAGLPAGPTPYGYVRVYDSHGRFVEQVEQPEQAAIVREIGAAIAGGASNASVARTLNDRGVPSPKGTRWTGVHIRILILNPRYVGRRVHQGEDFGQAVWPALLDAQTYRLCVERLSDPGRFSERGTELKWPLTGLPACTRCDAQMRTYWGSYGRQYLCFGCGRVAIKADTLDDFVITLVKERLRRPDGAKVFMPAADPVALAAAEVEEQALTDRLAEFHAEARKPLGLSAAAVAAAERDLTPLIEQAAAKVRRLSTPPALAALAHINIAEKWDDLTVRQHRDVIAALVGLRVGPGVRGRNRFDLDRLAESRWHGDEKTWGEHWAESA